MELNEYYWIALIENEMILLQELVWFEVDRASN
jgi:hypothetical protein